MKLENICANCQLITMSTNFGDLEIVYSYGTPVASWSGNSFHRHWNGYSATTLRHINKAFRPSTPITKAEWEKMEVRELEVPIKF